MLVHYKPTTFSHGTEKRKTIVYYIVLHLCLYGNILLKKVQIYIKLYTI